MFRLSDDMLVKMLFSLPEKDWDSEEHNFYVLCASKRIAVDTGGMSVLHVVSKCRVKKRHIS